MGRVNIDDLLEGMILDEDVYAPGIQIPLIKKGAVLNHDKIQVLKEFGVFHAEILGHSEIKNISVTKSSPTIGSKLKERSLKGIEDLFLLAKKKDLSPNLALKLVKSLDPVIDQIIGAISTDESSIVNINNLKSYDEYTYHHSLSVSVLSLAIGQQLKLSKDELRFLAKCAILHDMGKMSIPIEIINKPSRLTAEEFELIKTHPAEGYRSLERMKVGNKRMWRIVLLHHEKIDGTGYPFGLEGESIPLMSRIISVADVYDALTSYRPYRDPMHPGDAVEYLMGNVGTFFDFDVVVAFLKRIELYPVGSHVELSDGRIALVLNNENSTRPVVKIADEDEVLDLYWNPNCLKLTITQVFDGRELPRSQ